MILDFVKMLESASTGMMDGSVFGPKEGYEQASDIIFGLMLGTVAESLDTAAEGYAEENAALRVLFEGARAAVRDEALSARLQAAAGEGDESLRVSALREANQSLRALLIELHAHVEESAGAEARAVEARIWQELARSTERRRVALGPF